MRAWRMRLEVCDGVMSGRWDWMKFIREERKDGNIVEG
jgi:hypothetical protein